VSTSEPGTADVCIVRLTVGARPSPAPGRGPGGALPEGFGAELRRAGAGGLLQNAGGQPIDLAVPAEALERVRALMRAKPTIVSVHFDRPYVIPEIARESAALVATFGASDAALLDVLFGRFAPTGKLPFELPSSMEAVRAQKEDVPYDSKDPLFPFGAGLGYAKAKAR
jgi:beta-glucosidase